MPAHILIADDDASIRGTLAALCKAAGHRTSEAATGRETLDLVADERPDLVLLDLDMPEGSGLEILPALIERERAPSVVILTGYADVRIAVQAIQRGAANLLEKPVDGPDLLDVIERVLAARSVTAERDRLRDEVRSLRSGPIVGHSKAVQLVLEHVQRVARTPRTTVLIGGESGVGKELVARAVHEYSDRRDAPFVAVNCAAIADGLLEAELFGYEAGAFTGGKPKGHEGLIAAAEGGTLFLDEIGELDPALQAKLLRVLQERTYRRVGGNVDLAMDVRVVASTNRDLVAMVEEGRFREDLYYRLNVMSIVVPPLRERREDVARIATHFLAQFAADLGRQFSGFSEAALERLTSHDWPGNVRELRNTIERAVIMAHEGQIRPEHLGLSAELEPARRPEDGQVLRLASWALRDMEQALIERVLGACDGNRSQAARELGINRTTLYSKLKLYGIDS